VGGGGGTEGQWLIRFCARVDGWKAVKCNAVKASSGAPRPFEKSSAPGTHHEPLAAEERGLGRIEPAACERLRERHGGEVCGHIGGAGVDALVSQHLVDQRPLVLGGVGQVDLEELNARAREAVGGGVKARGDDDDLGLWWWGWG